MANGGKYAAYLLGRSRRRSIKSRVSAARRQLETDAGAIAVSRR